MQKKIVDFSSAYSQLILLVFLPIVLLASVGAYLVMKESGKAIKSEQRTLATAALIRYEPMVKKILPAILNNKNSIEATDSELNEREVEISSDSSNSQPASSANQAVSPQNLAISSELHNEDAASSPEQIDVVNQDTAGEGLINSMASVQNNISALLSSMNNNQHIQRVAIIDESGEVLTSSDSLEALPWLGSVNLDTNQVPTNFVEGISTPIGTAYGHLLGEFEGKKYWLFLEMDNEPMTIAQLKVWLGLGITGLFTLLLLLLSLNIYAKRWIAPIYDLRLHLQQITPENMYQPVDTESTGELNQLQQDLVKTLRRLYADFQELKDHSNQTEEDLRDAFDEMEMQNIFIREARDQAVSSSQAKSAFLANISHELRTPLNSIDGFINLLARHGELTAEQDLYVQTIRKSSAHLLALVNDVLDFSKIEAGKLILDKHEFSLYSTIHDVMDMLSPLAAEKGLRMAVMYYNDVPNTIVGDALRIKQVLTNLVGNAIKFTDVGEVVVRVGIDEAEDIESEARLVSQEEVSNRKKEQPRSQGDMIHIAIQDTGQGISEKAKQQLFQSFSQGDPSITRQYGGTGLGLVISKQLTRLMGGNIGFYDNNSQNTNNALALSEPGLSNPTGTKQQVRTGATFWFSIPSHIDVETPDDIEFGANFEDLNHDNELKLPVLSPFGNSEKEDKPLQMLVWINHASTVQVFMAAVRPLNIKVTMARSLAGALEKLKEGGNKWDWVIIDGGDSEAREDRAALLKQIRLHYQGKLAIYGYQVALDATLLERYKASGLYQPLDKRQLYGLLDTRSSVTSISTSQPTWQGVTVLAVDDHLPNLLVLDALLSELGIKVITANSGYDTIDIINKQIMSETYQLTKASADTDKKADYNDDDKGWIDLIFMDVQMPRMSGDEAAQKIRQLEKEARKEYKNYKRHIPIVALTAHGLADGKERLIAAGIDDYVGKPISRPQLLQILQRWLGKGVDALDNELNSIKPTYKESLTETKTSQPEQKIEVDSEHLIVDWKDALVRSANKPELAQQLLLMMQESVPDEIAALEAAWEMRDREELAQIAHRILGASRYSGVPQIRQASQDLEDKCLLNIQHTTPTQFAMLEEYYDALVTGLQALQDIDLEAYVKEQTQASIDKTLSENDMTWKMI